MEICKLDQHSIHRTQEEAFNFYKFAPYIEKMVTACTNRLFDYKPSQMGNIRLENLPSVDRKETKKERKHFQYSLAIDQIIYCSVF